MSRIMCRCKESNFDRVMFPERTGTTDLEVVGIETVLFKCLRSPA